MDCWLVRRSLWIWASDLGCRLLWRPMVERSPFRILSVAPSVQRSLTLGPLGGDGYCRRPADVRVDWSIGPHRWVTAAAASVEQVAEEAIAQVVVPSTYAGSPSHSNRVSQVESMVGAFQLNLSGVGHGRATGRDLSHLQHGLLHGGSATERGRHLACDRACPSRWWWVCFWVEAGCSGVVGGCAWEVSLA